ncbi:MAG: transposase, partial [Methylocella sp.]
IGLPTRTAGPARAVPGVERIDAAADRGCFKIADIEACERAGLTPHVRKPQRGSAVRKGFFAKDEFRHVPAVDVFVCPAGDPLAPRNQGKPRDLKKIDDSNPAACSVCPLRLRRTTSHRRVSRLANEAVLDRMAARPKAKPDILARRRETVEHRFGTIKQWMNQGAFPMKGLDHVRAEFSLTALVYDLRRALDILGADAMMAAVRA